MFRMAARLAPSTWQAPAWPVTWAWASSIMRTPVAPTGWPRPIRPPEGLMGNLPSGARCCRSCCCPGVRWSFDEGGRGLFIQFLERGHLDQDSPIYDTLHNDTSHLKRFIPYFQKVLPELSPEEIYWRLHFSLGALHYTITSLSRLNALSDGACSTGCFEETLERIIDYVEAGFRMAPRPKSA